MNSEPFAVGFVLARRSPLRTGQIEFLARQYSPGNAMKTFSLLAARTWESTTELAYWLEAQPEGFRAELHDNDFIAVPFVTFLGQPAQTLADFQIQLATEGARR